MILYSDIAVARYGSPFVVKVAELSAQLGFSPSWLMAVMKQESGINHLAVNKLSGATGLIQFMPATAKGLGTTVEALKAMSGVAQLDYVLKYFYRFRGKLQSPEDVYAAVFYPYMLDKPDSYLLGSEVSTARARLVGKQNPLFDLNKDGIITKAEFREAVRRKTFADLPEAEFKKKALL